jgi:hypothetical protein
MTEKSIYTLKDTNKQVIRTINYRSMAYYIEMSDEEETLQCLRQNSIKHLHDKGDSEILTIDDINAECEFAGADNANEDIECENFTKFEIQLLNIILDETALNDDFFDEHFSDQYSVEHKIYFYQSDVEIEIHDD